MGEVIKASSIEEMSRKLQEAFEPFTPAPRTARDRIPQIGDRLALFGGDGEVWEVVEAPSDVAARVCYFWAKPDGTVKSPGGFAEKLEQWVYISRADGGRVAPPLSGGGGG